MQEQIDLLRDKVANAQKILVGIGEEFEDRGFEQSDIYKCYRKKVERDGEAEWLIPYLQAYYLKTSQADEGLKKAYDNLAKLLDGRDYFVVTLRNDGRISQSGLNTERIVSPCGTYEKLQCSHNCSDAVQESWNMVQRIGDEVINGNSLMDIEKPICPCCGKEMTLNIYPQDKYCEAGYIQQWQEYQKWFAGTLNRQTLFLEAGAGFLLPNIIRWPFERAVYLNHKAFLYRIHKKFWQLSAEVGEKGSFVKENSVKFLGNL